MEPVENRLSVRLGKGRQESGASVYRYNSGVPYTIREFRPGDFEVLWRIDQTCFPAGIAYSRAELKTYIRGRQAFTVVAVNGRDSAKSKIESGASPANSAQSVAGFIVAECKPPLGHIITIDVVPETRRSGVGSLLLSSAERRLRVAGCHVVSLETAVDNLSALSFYKRQGYTVVGTFPRYYSNGVDALVLEKELGSVAK
jgi:[ribosomal protein S18]-alanine N-acetyltransferase